MLLSNSDSAALRRSSEIMLRPLEHSSDAEYLLAIANELGSVLGAFASVCGVRDRAGNVKVVSNEWSDATLNDFKRFKLNDAGTQRVLHLGTEIASQRAVVGDQWEMYHNDPMVNEWYKPNGVHDAIAYVLHWPEDDALATIEFHGATFGTSRFGLEGEQILGLLLPSFRAGIRVLHSVGEQRDRLSHDLETLGEPVAECRPDGAIKRRSAGMNELLETDAQSRKLLQHVRSAAQAVSPRQSTAQFLSSRAHQLVRTLQRGYRISAAHASQQVRSLEKSILVTAGALTPLSVTPEIVSERYHMTKREAEVAILLGHGARNDAIARALAISPHTARRHTERVLAKLGVANRAQAAAVLRSQA